MRIIIRLLPLLIVLLPVFARAAAIDDVVFDYGNGGIAYRMTNKSTSSRVFVTIRVDSTPGSYDLWDANLNEIPYNSPYEYGVLLLPGESKLLGVLTITMYKDYHDATKDEQIKLKYSKVGAYYPNPDLVFPDTDKVEDFFRFVKVRIPKDIADAACGAPPGSLENPEIIRALNLHTNKTITLTFKDSSSGTARLRTLRLSPLQFEGIVCFNMWDKISDISFRFGP